MENKIIKVVVDAVNEKGEVVCIATRENGEDGTVFLEIENGENTVDGEYHVTGAYGFASQEVLDFMDENEEDIIAQFKEKKNA